MNRTPCSPVNSILESDLKLATQQQTLKKLVVAETPHGFYIIAQFKWSGKKEWYLTTRRKRFKPKIFMDMERLNNHLRDEYPTDRVEIWRDQKVPEKGESLSGVKSARQERTRVKKAVESDG